MLRVVVLSVLRAIVPQAIEDQVTLFLLNVHVSPRRCRRARHVLRPDDFNAARVGATPTRGRELVGVVAIVLRGNTVDVIVDVHEWRRQTVVFVNRLLPRKQGDTLRPLFKRFHLGRLETVIHSPVWRHSVLISRTVNRQQQRLGVGVEYIVNMEPSHAVAIERMKNLQIIRNFNRGTNNLEIRICQLPKENSNVPTAIQFREPIRESPASFKQARTQ